MIHSSLSPSSAYRWRRCPASAWVAKNAPNESSVEAEAGTAAHAIAAYCIEHDMPVAEANGIVSGKKIPADDGSVKLLQEYVDLVLLLYNPDNDLLFVEKELDLSDIYRLSNQRGTVDAAIISPDACTIRVLDLKWGRGDVQAENNDQLLIYAAAVLSEATKMGCHIDRVEMIIFQPRVSTVPRIWAVDATEIGNRLVTLCAEAQIASVCYDSDVPPADDKYIPGEKQCRWCYAAKTGCEAQMRFIERELSMNFTDGASVNAVTTKIPLLTNERLATMYPCLNMLEKLVGDLRTEMLRRMVNGAAMPGYKIVEGRPGNRQWRDEAEAEKLLRRFKLKFDEMYTSTLSSPTIVERVLKKAGSLARLEKMNAIVYRKPGRPAVAIETDPRPPMVPVDLEFDDISGHADQPGNQSTTNLNVKGGS